MRFSYQMQQFEKCNSKDSGKTQAKYIEYIMVMAKTKMDGNVKNKFVCYLVDLQQEGPGFDGWLGQGPSLRNLPMWM